MKQLLFLLVWYFAFGPELYTFETKAQCERLQKHMKSNGMKVSECDDVSWVPNSKVEQHTSGANSPAIVGGKGSVIINGGKNGTAPDMGGR
jgi:hypothetical protein